MDFQKIPPKLFVSVAVIGVPITAALAVKETPKALQLIAEANAVTPKAKVNAAWKCYIPAMASGVITIAAIIANHSTLMRQNASLALAYGFGQTALRLYSEKQTPQVREQVAAIAQQANNSDTMILLDPSSVPEDMIVLWKDYISEQEFHASYGQVKYAVENFNKEVLQKEGEGSINQFYERLAFTELQTIGDNGDRLGWKYSPEYPEIIPMRYAGFAKNGAPCAMLDFVNPPQYGFDNKFA